MSGFTGARMRVARTDSTVVTKLALGSAILMSLVVLMALAAVALGPVETPFPNAVRALVAAITGTDAQGVPDIQHTVIQEVRLPRVVLALCIGAALAVAGAIMQAIFRNPLADPGIVGTSAGGALGAVVLISLGVTGSIFYVPAAAVAGATLSLLLVFLVSYLGGRMNVPSLLLTGVALGALLGAAVSVVILMTDSLTAQREMYFWLSGGFEGTTWASVKVLMPVVLLGITFAVLSGRNLNLLLVGDDEAKSLGINVRLFRLLMLVMAATLTGIAVAFAGIVGFVGLVVPHAIRLIAGPDHRHLIVLSALGGALFVLAADTVARTIISPAELRVGIVTAVVGGPTFIALLVSTKSMRNGL